MSKNLKTGKLSIGIKLGYSMGQIGDSLAYNLFFIFFFYFLTEIALVGPFHAGVINLIVILWDAISDPIIGYLSDNWNSKFGRRRPFILTGAFPLAILIFLSFTAFDLSETGKFIYYAIVALLFWTSYTMVDIPYYSLGAEISQDFDERIKLRIWGSFAIHLAVAAVGFAPLLASILGGEDLQKGWSMTGLVIGATTLFFELICWNSTRGREVDVSGVDKIKKLNIFKTYVQALKLKPIKFVVGANFFYLLGQAISLGVTMHILTYIAPLTDFQVTIFWTFSAFFSILLLPVINRVSLNLGKKGGFISLIGIMTIVFVIFYLVGIYTFASMMILAVVAALGNGAFWTLCYAMAYDNTELDEFINGERREGIFIAFMSFSQKVGNAVGILALGMILNIVKYDATLTFQPTSAIVCMKLLLTLCPALFFTLSIVIVFFHPMTKKKFHAVENALEAKRNGETPDTSEFQDLL